MSGRSLDTLDELDRRIIVALQEDGRASWRAVADAVGSSVATVARRGQQLIADGVVRIVVVPALGSTGPVDAFVARINCLPGTQLAVAADLAALPDVRFLSLVTGGYDIIAELIVRGGAAHYPQLVGPLQSIAGVERWRSDLIMHVYKIGHDWGRQVFDGAPPPAARDECQQSVPQPCRPEHFDQQDWAMLAALGGDGRLPFTKLAEQLGMNESSVRRRFERLRGSRCVDTVTLVPAPALGMGAETLMTVTVHPACLEAVVHELARYTAVRYLAATLDDNSLFCEVITPSTTDLHAFIIGTLSRLDGVQGWSASMELLSLKRGFVETPWWRTQVGHEEA
jgi:DNA-binding Lrp family transcriptional regulator